MSHPSLSLRHNFLWTLMGNVVYAGCQWGMLVVLAKLGTPVMVGQFALGLAICAPVIMFGNMALRAVQVSDARLEYLFGHYLGLRLITTALALLLISGITYWGGYRRETALVILAVGLAKAIESISDVLYGLLQLHERMDRISISMMIKGPLSLVVLGGMVYLSDSVMWGALGLAGAWAIILIGYDIRSGALILKGWLKNPKSKELENVSRWGAVRPLWVPGRLGKLAWLAIPLGIATMLHSLGGNIPRYFIEHYLGERELGIFAAIAYLMVCGGTVVGALGQSASPRLAKYQAAGNRAAFSALLLKLVGLGALLGVAGVLVVMVAGREILSLIYRPEYAEHADVLLWLMVAAGIAYVGSFLGNGMTSLRYFRAQIPLFAMVASTSAFLCLWLIPTWGMRGAAMAVTISASVQVVFTFAIVWHGLQNLHKNLGKLN